jgi:hypothetical protein
MTQAWQAIRILEKGSRAHHRQLNPFNFCNPDTGITETTPAANLKILHKHFHNVYNRDDAPVDHTVLDDIRQREVLPQIGEPPTMDEMQDAISSLANNKAPGASGVTAEALKALPPCAAIMLHNLILDFWNGAQHTYDEWQMALLRIIYKGKGDQKDPNNYRGIVLQDALARLTSTIITKRLTELVKHCGIEEQFAYQPERGMIDALYCLHSALQLRREHQ